MQITGETVGEVRAVSGMHQRKAEMARNSDAFIALPGGYGTLEELLEVIAWAQLGIHSKPVGLLNVDGYYDFLLAFIDKAVDDGFIKPAQRHIFVSAPDARALVHKLEVLLRLLPLGVCMVGDLVRPWRVHARSARTRAWPWPAGTPLFVRWSRQSERAVSHSRSPALLLFPLPLWRFGPFLPCPQRHRVVLYFHARKACRILYS